VSGGEASADAAALAVGCALSIDILWLAGDCVVDVSCTCIHSRFRAFPCPHVSPHVFHNGQRTGRTFQACLRLLQSWHAGRTSEHLTTCRHKACCTASPNTDLCEGIARQSFRRSEPHRTREGALNRKGLLGPPDGPFEHTRHPGGPRTDATQSAQTLNPLTPYPLNPRTTALMPTQQQLPLFPFTDKHKPADLPAPSPRISSRHSSKASMMRGCRGSAACAFHKSCIHCRATRPVKNMYVTANSESRPRSPKVSKHLPCLSQQPGSMR